MQSVSLTGDTLSKEAIDPALAVRLQSLRVLFDRSAEQGVRALAIALRPRKPCSLGQDLAEVAVVVEQVTGTGIKADFLFSIER